MSLILLFGEPRAILSEHEPVQLSAHRFLTWNPPGTDPCFRSPFAIFGCRRPFSGPGIIAMPETIDEPVDPRTSKNELQRTMVFVPGDKQAVYTIEEGHLRAVSKFFEPTQNRLLPEPERQWIFLDEHDSHTFKLFVHWLYSGTLPVVSKDKDDDGEREYLELAKAWALGNDLKCARFQNIVIDALSARRAQDYDQRRGHPLIQTVEYVYSHTEEDSQLRSLMISIYAQEDATNRISRWKDRSRIPHAFLAELADELTECLYNPNDELPEVEIFYVSP
ncbi:hypothetical protein BJX68DRAFT_267220 [Aspergillus pseudodeflectus]|uniref:BTB domain-containing protein n=1 Tax=Aspergillus pseudodeflectus TaxID=176178 RepID=A0ABR4KAQ0_9EURO